MPAIICMLFLFNSLHLITFCLFSLVVGHSSLYQMSLLYRRDEPALQSQSSGVHQQMSEELRGRRGNHSFSCTGMVMLPSCSPPRHQNRHTSSQLSVSRVRASRHIKEKYLLPIQSFGTDSIFTCTAIASNYIVLIHSQGTF